MASVCVFDVNETLLDLAALDPHFARVFGDASVRQAWFQQMLQSAFVATITGAYSDFGSIGQAALTMLAARRGVTVSADDQQRILGGMRQLPAHPDVREGVQRLRDVGLRVATLTNSTAEVAEAQMAASGLRDLFELVLSADTVRRLKPAPEPYHMAAERLGVAPADLWLIAAHAWDVAGAQRAGCRAAFVARPGMVLDPLAPRPQVVAADLRAVADGIIAAERG